jgi:hypothetical protein
MAYSYSDWVQLPDVELVMTNVNSVHWGVDRDEADQADVFIRDGDSGGQHPRGQYDWKRALAGDKPQDFVNAYHVGWKGTVNYNTTDRWYNSVDSATWVGAPLVHWPNPDNLNAGLAGQGQLQSGFSWTTSFNNATLSSFWLGSYLSYTLGEVVTDAGPLGTGAGPSTDPTDPIYDGLFDPGAEAIEFETTECELLDLHAAADESRVEPELSDGLVMDISGPNWAVVDGISDVWSALMWGYYYNASHQRRLAVSEDGVGAYLASALVDDWGNISPAKLDVSGTPDWQNLPMTDIEANGGVIGFLVIPKYAADNSMPDFAPYIDTVAGNMNIGSWRTVRAKPVFALKAEVRPTRIRARYPVTAGGGGIKVWSGPAGEWLSQGAGSVSGDTGVGRLKVWNGSDWQLAEPLPGEGGSGRLKVWSGTEWLVTAGAP